MEFVELLNHLEGVREYSTYAVALCPYHHDRQASMLVFKDGRFRCLSCGAKGGFKELERKLIGWMPPAEFEAGGRTEAFLPTDLYELEKLVHNANYLLMTFPDPLALYLKRRGIESRVVPNKLGYWQGWYTIPVYDRYFRGVILRAGNQKQEQTGTRFTQPKGQKAMLYVPDPEEVERNDYLVVVYGMIDALSMAVLGIPAVTGTTGKNSVIPEMLEPYRKRILLLPDKGEEDTALKLCNALGWRGELVKFEYPEGTKDPNDLLVQGYSDILVEEIERRIK